MKYVQKTVVIQKRYCQHNYNSNVFRWNKMKFVWEIVVICLNFGIKVLNQEIQKNIIKFHKGVASLINYKNMFSTLLSLK